MNQTPLPLDQPPPLPLREAFQQSGLARRYTFEQAMSKRALAVMLRLHAEVILRRKG